MENIIVFLKGYWVPALACLLVIGAARLVDNKDYGDALISAFCAIFLMVFYCLRLLGAL